MYIELATMLWLNQSIVNRVNRDGKYFFIMTLGSHYRGKKVRDRQIGNLQEVGKWSWQIIWGCCQGGWYRDRWSKANGTGEVELIPMGQGEENIAMHNQYLQGDL